MDKIVVFGINGFTGKHFQVYIEKQNLASKYQIIGIDKFVDRNPHIDNRAMDLSLEGSIEKLIVGEKPDFIMNLAGLFGAESYNELYKVNADISRRLLETVANNKFNVKKIVLIGSAAEYGIPTALPVDESHHLSPVSPYGLTKAIQAAYLDYFFRNHGINVCLARTFNILGKGLSEKLSIGSFTNQIRKIGARGTIITGNLMPKRDYLDVQDCVDAYWRILISGEPGNVFNVCSGSSESIKHILELLINLSGKEIAIQTDTTLLRKNDLLDFYGDNSKLKKTTGWKQLRTLENSLKDMLS